MVEDSLLQNYSSYNQVSTIALLFVFGKNFATFAWKCNSLSL